MVWLNMVADNGSGLYLDISGVEQRRSPGGAVLAISGLVGDGRYEGQVLIEVGSRVEVTFVDQWLDPAELKEFFSRVERDEVERALEETVAAMSLEEKIRMIVEAPRSNAAHRPHTSNPHPYRREKKDLSGVREIEANWERANIPANDK